MGSLEFLGKMVSIRILDQATGGWGTHQRRPSRPNQSQATWIRNDVQRSFQANGRYLNIPIKNGAPKRLVTLLVDGKEDCSQRNRIGRMTKRIGGRRWISNPGEVPK